MKLHHSEQGAHWYASDGSPHHDADMRVARKLGLLYSVTTALKMWPKDFLEKWKIGQAIEIALDERRKNPLLTDADIGQMTVNRMETDLDAAAEWGRTTHGMFEHYALHQKFPKTITEDFQPWCEPIEKWFSAHVVKVLFSEKVMVNKVVGYAGTCDLGIISKHWGFAICDFKRRGFRDGRGNYYPTDPVQMEAYARCQPDGQYPDSIVSIAVNRDHPEVESMLWPHENRDAYWRKFLCCFDLLCMVKNYRPPHQHELPMAVDPTPPPPKAKTKRPRAKRFKGPKPVQMEFQNEEPFYYALYSQILI